MLSARRGGFTLTELLVAMAAMGMVIFYSLGTFTVQHQTYMVVDQVSEVQQNSRAVAALMERDIRAAGYMVPAETAACGVDNANAADLLFVSDTDAILPLDDAAFPAELRASELGADTATASASGSLAVAVDNLVIDGTATYDLDNNGSNDSDFQVGGGAILADLNNSERGVACGVVTAVSTTAPQSVTVSFGNALSSTIPLPADLRLVPAHVYQVVTPGGGAPSELRRDGMTLAKGVEDLQLAWFYDDDPGGTDGEVDAGEYRGVSGTAYVPAAVDGNDLRELRVNLVLRSKADHPRKPDAAGRGQSRENRTANLAGDDGRLRRVHTVTVRTRNIAL